MVLECWRIQFPCQRSDQRPSHPSWSRNFSQWYQTLQCLLFPLEKLLSIRRVCKCIENRISANIDRSERFKIFQRPWIRQYNSKKLMSCRCVFAWDDLTVCILLMWTNKSKRLFSVQQEIWINLPSDGCDKVDDSARRKEEKLRTNRKRNKGRICLAKNEEFNTIFEVQK